MSLPARSLSDSGKASGMGVFFTVYYVAFLATPPLAGWVAEALGTLSGAFLVGGSMQALAFGALVGFARWKVG